MTIGGIGIAWYATGSRVRGHGIVTGHHVGGQIRMVDVHSFIDDSDHDAGRSGRDVPGRSSLHVGSDGAPGLPGILHIPLIGKERIVRCRHLRQVMNEVWLGNRNLFQFG